MSNLSWNEIRQRAIQFAHDWQDVTDERAEAQSFWNEFFQVFGIGRRTVASFGEPVNSLKNQKKAHAERPYRLSLSRSLMKAKPWPTSTCPPPC